ncbi:MAG TPA: alpha/beta hydrolase-fold protein [Chloroflexia bacterium]|nr:alpha/beta hydrolase-fold protein [Chloroflexia bacterium]
MNREYHKWYSPHLGHDMEFLLFGHAGRPILVFPTSMGRFYQNEDFKMIDAIAGRLEAGQVQLLCVDGIDNESWYNRSISVRDRALRHNAYEAYLIHEVLPWWRDRNPGVVDNLVTTGASFGAYHAVNFSFKHPDLVRKIVAMSGAYGLAFLISNGLDQEAYFNSPIDYLPNLHDDWYLARMRAQEIILAVGSDDICLESTRKLSNALWAKAVPNLLDIWGGAWHDWPIWRDMAVKFLY